MVGSAREVVATGVGPPGSPGRVGSRLFWALPEWPRKSPIFAALLSSPPLSFVIMSFIKRAVNSEVLYAWFCVGNLELLFSVRWCEAPTRAPGLPETG